MGKALVNAALADSPRRLANGPSLARRLPRSRRPALVLLLTIGALTIGLVARAEVRFNRDIRPILVEHCLACHGSDAESREAELRLDTAEGAHEGAIVPGEPDQSEVVARVFADDPNLVMPPPAADKPLSEEQKDLLRRWVEAGAQYEDHWAFVAPRKPSPPEVADGAWAKNGIDRFVLARLEAEGLVPADEADPYAIGRRVTLDVTGLPPTAEDADAFAEDYRARGDAALSDRIDLLMETPAWGEHRARYWLDAARYGDTHGLHYDNYREMWLYRDWVIRAFNDNKPFDEFTIEQLAGDLLPDPTDDQQIATGLQRCNITTNEGGTIPEENLAVYAADRVQTFGWVYLGLTTNCAQCHDHKFDPISMRDYYALAAFFRNTTEPALDNNAKQGGGATLVVPPPEDRDRWEALPAEIDEAAAQLAARDADAEPDFRAWLEGVTEAEISALAADEGLVFHAPLNRVEGPTVHARAVGAAVESAPTEKEVKWIADGKTGPAPLLGDEASFEFQGVGDLDLDCPFTLALWVRPHADAQTGPLFSRVTRGEKRHGWELTTDNHHYVVSFVDERSDGGMKVTTEGRVVRAGVWQHVLVTYDGSRTQDGVKIYVDGKPEKTFAWFNNLKPASSIHSEVAARIGGGVAPKPATETALQDARIYGRALSETEARDLVDAVVIGRLIAAGPGSWDEQQRGEVREHFLRRVDEPHHALFAAHRALTREREQILARSPLTHVQKERDQPARANILLRGAYDAPGDEVAAAPPETLHDLPEGAPANRLGLARWVVDPANPLTARVTVNRCWQEVFGRGIVPTAEDFGVVGAPPSHPDLLDWIAVDFRENGWDVKRLYKQMLMSAAYRQAAVTTPVKLARDRDNALLSRGPRFRMDAEMVRDGALAASGLLSRKMYGPGVKPYQPPGIWDLVGMPGGDTRDYRQDKGEDLYRRSVYSFWKRMAPPANLEVFNAPSREVCTVRRERTNTPLQALTALNDPQFVEAARRLAETITPLAAADPSAAIDRLALAVLGRRMVSREAEIVRQSYEKLALHYEADPEAAARLIRVGDSEPSPELDPAALAAWTMVCNQVLNLDEAITK